MEMECMIMKAHGCGGAGKWKERESERIKAQG